MSPSPQRCVSVRTVPGGGWVYQSPAIYEAAPRRGDGVLTWRGVSPSPLGTIRLKSQKTVPSGFRSRGKAVDAGLSLAHVRHGALVGAP